MDVDIKRRPNDTSLSDAVLAGNSNHLAAVGQILRIFYSGANQVKNPDQRHNLPAATRSKPALRIQLATYRKRWKPNQPQWHKAIEFSHEPRGRIRSLERIIRLYLKSVNNDLRKSLPPTHSPHSKARSHHQDLPSLQQ